MFPWERQEELHLLRRLQTCGGKSERMWRVAQLHEARAQWLRCRSGALAARPSWEKSVRLLTIMLRSYPRFRRIDAVAFQRARALTHLDPREAIEALDAFVADHPEDPRVTGARLLAADAHTRLGNHAIATARYGALDLQPDHPEYALTKYRHSWAAFRLGQTDDAITLMDEVIATTRDPQLEAAARVDRGRFLTPEPSHADRANP